MERSLFGAIFIILLACSQDPEPQHAIIEHAIIGKWKAGGLGYKYLREYKSDLTYSFSFIPTGHVTEEPHSAGQWEFTNENKNEIHHFNISNEDSNNTSDYKNAIDFISSDTVQLGGKIYARVY